MRACQRPLAHLWCETAIFEFQEAFCTQKCEDVIQQEAFFTKIEGLLANASNPTSSEKQRSMALKTAQMLMKSKAWGDVEDVNTKDPSNRMYFIVEFAETGTKKIVYFGIHFLQ